MIDRYLQRHVKLIHTGVCQQVTGHRHPAPRGTTVGGAEALGGGRHSLWACEWNKPSCGGHEAGEGFRLPQGAWAAACAGHIPGIQQNA